MTKAQRVKAIDSYESNKQDARTTAAQRGQEKAETMRITDQGATLTEIRRIFGCSLGYARTKISDANIAPSILDNGQAVFPLREVAEVLVVPKGDLVEVLSSLAPTDLPPALHRDFWNGMRASLQYEIMCGELWRTDEIVSVVGQVFKTLRMQVLLVQDQVERQQELPPRVRQVISDLMDGMLRDMTRTLTEEMRSRGRDFKAERPKTDYIEEYRNAARKEREAAIESERRARESDIDAGQDENENEESRLDDDEFFRVDAVGNDIDSRLADL